MPVVGTQLSLPGWYLPPLLKSKESPAPPQTIISVPVQTAVCKSRGDGASATLVAFQLSVAGSYLPPLFKSPKEKSPVPPQTIISLSVQTAVCKSRGSGALEVLVAVQLSVPGIYLPPVLTNCEKLERPQTIISVPVHTAV